MMVVIRQSMLNANQYGHYHGVLHLQRMEHRYSVRGIASYLCSSKAIPRNPCQLPWVPNTITAIQIKFHSSGPHNLSLSGSHILSTLSGPQNRVNHYWQQNNFRWTESWPSEISLDWEAYNKSSKLSVNLSQL